MPVQWLFFDIGWTLVDEAEAHRVRNVQAVALLSTLGVAISESELAENVAETSRAMVPSPFATALRRLTADQKQFDYVRKGAPYDHQLERLYPEVLSVLPGLARRYQIGVIANQSAGAQQRLHALGVGPYISVCIGSAEAGYQKPDHRIFRLALERAKTTAADSVMIGDRLDNDILPAKEVGLRTVWIVRGVAGTPMPPTKAHEPDFTIPDLSELPSVIDRLR